MPSLSALRAGTEAPGLSVVVADSRFRDGRFIELGHFNPLPKDNEGG
jgi:ribosomal protein S16